MLYFLVITPHKFQGSANCRNTGHPHQTYKIVVVESHVGRSQDFQESALAASTAGIRQIDEVVHFYVNMASRHQSSIPSHSPFRHTELLAYILWRSVPGEGNPDYSPSQVERVRNRHD